MKAEPESRFTAPTHICPYPERWSSTDDASTEVEVSHLLAGLVIGLQPSLVIETGAAWGQTTELIGHALSMNGHGTLVSLEIDEDRAYHARQRCSGLPVAVFGISSLEYEPLAPIDFIFFDSEFPLRIDEFRHYRPFMTNRTVVAFHDTASQAGSGQFPEGDLRANIQWNMVDTGLLSVIDLPTPRGLTIGRVL